MPFPRPPREFTRPSFLPDSDDGGMDPGQALRNDGLNPPRPPTLGGRLRGRAAFRPRSGGDRGGRRGGRGGSGEERDREPDDAGPARRRRLAGQNSDNPHSDEVPAPQIIGRPRGGTASRPGHRELRFQHRKASPLLRRQRRERAAAAEAGGGALALLGEGVGAATEGLAVAGAGAALVGTAWAIEGGLNAASHLMGWGAATGGGTDSDASRPSMTTDVQTRNGMQESGAVDHYNIQEQRRAQRPEVFRIDTESESEPRNRPLPQVRSRPARRSRLQAQTPFGLNNVPIPVSSGSERSRVSRQSRGDRGPLGTQPSFEALRQASEPEAA